MNGNACVFDLRVECPLEADASAVPVVASPDPWLPRLVQLNAFMYSGFLSFS